MSHQHSRHRETIRALKADPALFAVSPDRHCSALDTALDAVEAFGRSPERFDLDAFFARQERAA